MSRIVQRALPGVEVNRVEKLRSRALNKVEQLEEATRELRMAKAGFGAAVGVAIGDAPDKTFGDKGHISNVKSGAAVPDYLARIYADPDACLRLGLELLKRNPKVTVRPHWTVDIDEG